MSLTLFSVKNNWWRNGIWWFTKMGNRALGEERWEYLRVFRRIQAAKMFYARQQILYEIFIEAPDVCNLLGAYPKVDSSHGFPHYYAYEMFRDFQENTINSDGWFGMWIVLACSIYLVGFYYSYMIPFYWIHTPLKNEEETRLRMKDVLSSTVLEEIYGTQYAEFAWQPHDFHYMRIRGVVGYTHPDDPRAMAMASFNRKHKYKEHYMKSIGNNHSMVYPR